VDKWNLLLLLDEQERIVDLLPTYF
jgi:hypothetical protein